jgi:hypothetical protein
MSMDFILGFPRMQSGHDFVMIVVDRFLKMIDFISCMKTIYATKVVSLFFKDIMKLHGMPRSITYDRDMGFLRHFSRKLWKNMGSKLFYNYAYHPQMDG